MTRTTTHIIIVLLLAAATSIILGCRGRTTTALTADSLLLRDSFLPLPTVPARCTTAAARADYLLQHFWDALSFRDTAVTHNEAFVERNFVNFLSLFPHADSTALSPAITTLLTAAQRDTVAVALISELAEKYLYDPSSPQRNEDYYLVFLDALLATKNLSDEQRQRPQGQRTTVLKNRRGTVAADFRFYTREGMTATLYSFPAAEELLVVFYDPACGHCTDILQTLAASTVVAQQLAEGHLAVLAVYTEGDDDLWDSTKAAMPAAWTVAIDRSEIVANALYHLAAMPTLYLLDRHRRVLLKDPTVLDVEEHLLLSL